MPRKGLLLAGGLGTRLYPVTRAVSKQLLPVYDKPLVYYPLTILMMAGIREILIITTATDLPSFQTLLGDGAQWGLELSYAVQPKPGGIAEAFVVAADYLGESDSALVLGDNIFYGQDLPETIRNAANKSTGATIFAIRVVNPRDYGVVEFGTDGTVLGIEEKPAKPRSNFAATGLYFYDKRATKLVMDLRPSSRGELEITDLNMAYMKLGDLHVQLLGRGTAWLDTGTHSSLLQAGLFIETIEQRQGLKIACPEEIAFRMGYIDKSDLARLARPLAGTKYGEYLQQIVEE